jgi:hypothetical protein
MHISFADVSAVKREGKLLRRQYPETPHSQLLSEAARSLFGVRNFHELNKLREKTIAEYLEGSESLATCTYCGLQFCPDVADDRKQHRVRHDSFEEAVSLLQYKPDMHSERESSKKEGYSDLESNDAAVQLSGALKVIRAWFDRSLDAAIDGGYWKKHPTFDQYVAFVVGDLSAFPDHIVTSLEARFGRIDGVIPKGRSYWYPPKS